jgi:hypothetical protein
MRAHLRTSSTTDGRRETAFVDARSDRPIVQIQPERRHLSG